MRKQLAAALALCLLLTACGGSGGSGGAAGADEESGGETAWSAEQIAWAVWESQEETPGDSRGLAGGETAFADYLAAYYQLDPETVMDGYLRCAGGMSGFELAVLRLRKDTDLTAAEEALLRYRDSRAGDFTGYLPEQADMVEHGAVVLQGSWAALLLCPQAEAAREVFLDCFGEDAPAPETPRWPEGPAEEPSPEEPKAGPLTEPPEEAREASPGETGEAPRETAAETPAEDPADPSVPSPKPEPDPAPGPGPEPEPEPEPAPEPEEPAPAPTIPDTYDGGAVRSAWASGDDSGLSEKSRAVLETAREVIDANIRDGMSAYQKELAIHDWMVAWASYDHSTLSRVPGEEGSADNENPYGFLTRKKGICLGYASTFQLFMDLLDIPCRTVNGTAHAGTADHAWNLVRLDGEWYGVDVTWDDPTTHIKVTRETAHRYFNVTSQFLRDNDHQWDAAGVPEAEGTAWAWKK